MVVATLVQEATMTKVWFDFETYSAVDIKKEGGYKYSVDDSTNVICLAWAIDDGPVNLWTPAKEAPVELLDAVFANAKMYAHNIMFDQRIWNNIMVEHFSWPYLPLENCVDTKALCAVYSLPLSLDKAGDAMKIKMPKQKAGKALIRLLCVPNKKGGQPLPHDPVYQAKFREFFEYCKRDVEAMRELVKALPRDELIPIEQQIWELTVEMNTTGLPIAFDEVVAIREYLTKYIDQEMHQVPKLTIGQIDKVTQTVAITNWINEQGYPLKDLTVASVEEALDDPKCAGNIRRLLELRQELGKSSVAKFNKLIDQVVEHASGQHWVYDNLEYHGAGPGRWSGRGFQMHNLPRYKLKDPEPYIQKFLNKEPIEDPVSVAKGLIRPMIKAPPQYTLYVLDYDSIENKVLHWLADDWDTITDFKAGVDQYKTMASARYKVAYDEVSKGQRQMGKVIILGCIAAGTLVLTDSGAKCIEHITIKDKLWDGDTWVSHDGLLYKGPKPCIPFNGIFLTKDHEVFISDNKEEVWRHQGNIQSEKQAICLVIGKLLNSFPEQTLLNEMLATMSSAQYAEPSITKFWLALKKVIQLNAETAEGKPNINLVWQHIQSLRGLIKRLSIDLSIDGTPLKLGVLFEQLQNMIIMEVEELVCSKIGWTHLYHLFFMLWNCPDSTIRISSSTELIMTETTNRITSDLFLDQKICLTHDILNSGKKHRFAILTPNGPMLVSNCGFGMGYETFIKTAKRQFSMEVSEEEAREAINAYREKYHLVKQLWNDLKTAAVRAVLTGQRQTVRKITFGLGIAKGVPWLAMQLPSGKCVYYCKPTVEGRHIPKYEHMGKVPTIIHHGRHPKTGQWTRIPLIPGRITENAVQGTAREVMAQGLLNVRERMPEMTLIGTVHDEGLGLVPHHLEEENTLDKFAECLCDIPWAKDCPITASGYTGQRYKKD